MTDESPSWSDQFKSFLNLDLLADEDSCPSFDIINESYFSASQFSTDSSSSTLEIDLQDEWEYLIKSKGSRSIVDQNNLPVPSISDEDKSLETMKEDNLERDLNNNFESSSSSLMSVQMKVNQLELSSELMKDEDCEDFPSVSVKNFVKPKLNPFKLSSNYIRHIQPMPQRTSPLPPRKKMLSQSNVNHSFHPSGRLEEEEVTYLGRAIVPLKLCKKSRPGLKSHPQSSSTSPSNFRIQGNSISLLRYNPPQLKPHSLNPNMYSVVISAHVSPSVDSSSCQLFKFPSPGILYEVISRSPSTQTHKLKKTVSILKPVNALKQIPVYETEPNFNITAAEVSLSHSNAGQVHLNPLQRKRKMMTKKRMILSRYVNWPTSDNLGIETNDSESGWVPKDDPFKEKKNQVERERRGELAKYRDKLREILPFSTDEKVSTVTVLESAREFCIDLQSEVYILDRELKKLERRNNCLNRILNGYKSDLNSRGNITEKLTIQKFFETFEV